MPYSPVGAQSAKIGTCPHGLPIGACPICNGMGSGGAGRRDVPRKAGEMTYNECAAMGAILRANKHAKEVREANFQARLSAMAQLEKNIQSSVAKTLQFAQMIEKSMPAIIAKPVSFVLTNVVARGLNFVQNVVGSISNFAQNFTQKLADITDKLTAVYGELKTAVEKKISDIREAIKERIRSVFGIFRNKKDEEKQVEETKKAFKLKTFLHKLYRKLKKEKEND